MIERPYGIVVDGRLELGLELVTDPEAGTFELRPHTGIPESFILSTWFVNAHSHLEYRGLQGKVQAQEYWPWIRELTELKKLQTPEEVAEDCHLAASENSKTGVGTIAEHSDRPYSGIALAQKGIDGMLFQELITFFEKESPAEKIRLVQERVAAQAKDFPCTALAPHAPYTVDDATLFKYFGGGMRVNGKPAYEVFSIHVAETTYERAWISRAEGPIADFQRAAGYTVVPRAESVVAWLKELGLVRYGAQFVHCCDVSDSDISLMAEGGVAVAHCPRSNLRLKCPAAPVRRMLDAGLPVGLGMDSAASSGPIDMFAEMRAALQVSHDLGEPLTPEQVWAMAVSDLPWSYGERYGWIKIHVEGATSIEDVIEQGTPERVEWLG